MEVPCLHPNPIERMAFVVTTLKAIFVLLNITSFLSSAVYLGFGGFLLISKFDVMGIGLHEMSVILLATGAFMIILATIGCCAGVGRRKWAMQFFSGILLIETVYQTGLGILTLIQRGKSENNMDSAWNDLSQTMRDTFETANKCCGFKFPQDRTGCSEERIANSVSCSTKLNERQQLLLLWLASAVFILTIISFLNFMIAHQLVREYKKAKREFKHRQSERLPTKHSRKAGGNEGEEVEDAVKTVKIERNKSPMSYLPDFLKPTPKPVIARNETEAPRASGTMLTYEQIAEKYRKQ